MKESYKSLIDKFKASEIKMEEGLKSLKSQRGTVIDQLFKELHNQAFEKIDCLQCANCCKTTGPLLLPIDIQRLAKAKKMSSGVFLKTYLKLDEDEDWVFKSMPCPMLGENNYCSVYEDRPTACREYPHTDDGNMKQKLEITKKNCAICPAVADIVTRLGNA